MRAAVLLALFAALATDARSASLPWTRTRAMSPAAGALLQLATERSAEVRAILDELERADVVVLLTFPSEPAGPSVPDFMTFLTEAAGTRFVAVHMRWRSLPSLAYVPLLAHELQHALELAAAGDVHDCESYARLFRTIGWPVRPGQFETERARATEERVRRELFGQGAWGEYESRRRARSSSTMIPHAATSARRVPATDGPGRPDQEGENRRPASVKKSRGRLAANACGQEPV